uniref:RNA-dependent RNA polymerase n=1 Tax=Chinese broad-headed pond turtle astro-like virus TaxID=2116326 RepID=A0A2P1GND8_9VIRU|nr:RNA-dependent RNA polymerase [Chinese broad-headed pond turtle astro-like virus]
MIWVKLNKIDYKVHKNFDSLPSSLLTVDYTWFENERKDFSVQEIMRKFYQYLERKMQSVSITIPVWLTGRDYHSAIFHLMLMDVIENNFDLSKFEPGPGFDWLKTGVYKRGCDNVMGGPLPCEYIQNAIDGVYDDVQSLQYMFENPKPCELGVELGRNIVEIGMVPPRTRKKIQNIYQHGMPIPPYNLEAKRQFGEVVEEYGLPFVTLQNEYKSVAKFCQHENRNCDLDGVGVEVLLEGFEYMLQDWLLGVEELEPSTMDEVCKKKNWSSSPGYPYNRRGCRTGREAYDLSYPYIYSSMEWSKYDWMPVVQNVIVKFEMIKKEKVIDGNVRTIIAPPICNQMMGQRLLNPLSEHVTENHEYMHVQIGYTKFGRQCDQLATRMSKHGVIFEYDVTRWDRSVKALLLKLYMLFCWVTLSTQDIGDLFQLANVFETSIYSWMAHSSGVLLRKAYGLPSGFIHTSCANSWIHTFMVVTCFIHNRPDASYKFRDHVDLICYGDDGLMTVNTEILPWFGPRQLMSWFWRWGLCLPDVIVHHSLECRFNGDVKGVTFLGDVFRLVDGKYYPVTKIGKVLASICHNTVRKNYTPGELWLMYFTHYVECFWHDQSDILYRWLCHYTDAMKVEVKIVNVDSDILKWLSVSGNELIQIVLTMLHDKKQLDTYIFDKFYRS